MTPLEKSILKLEIKKEWEDKYNKSLESHLKYFREAAEKLGVNEEQIKYHDTSKTSFMEYRLYVRKFGGGINDDLFLYAWSHHIHNNPHHWQHWIIPYKSNKNTALEMPHHYILEMIADWMGSSKAYTGSFDMTEWLKVHLPTMVLHKNTREEVMDILINTLNYNVKNINN